jgi:hypothetical protein
MKPGDLVRFGHTMWPAAVGGKIALVLDVRKNPFGMWEDDIEFDVLMDGAVVEGLINSRWNRSPDEGIEILVQSCATAVGS